MAQYVHKINNLEIAASEAVPGSPLALALAAISGGAFRVVPLTEGANPVPDPEHADPPVELSGKIIYLTKEEGSQATDPYTEWIWIEGTGGEADKWEIIGTTSMALDELEADVTSSDGAHVQVEVIESEGKITEVHITTDTTETVDNKITSWGTPTNDQYPSAKLVDDTKADKVTVAPGEDPTGHVPELDNEGNLEDSGINADDLVTDVRIDGEVDSLVVDHVATIPKAEPASASTSSTTVNSEWGVVTIATMEI